LLFSREHYLASAEAYLRGIERRIDASLNPNVPLVASVFNYARSRRIYNFGARPQRLLWASTGRLSLRHLPRPASWVADQWQCWARLTLKAFLFWGVAKN